jgi:hypothetical protein
LLAGSAAGPVMRSWAAGWAPAAAREWSSPGRGDRLPSRAQAPGRHTGQRTCPQARCGGAVERAVRADGHLLPGHHRPAGPGDFPRQLSPGRDHPSSGCRAAGFTWRSSGLGRHRTRAAGLTSWVFCLPDAAARDQMQARLAAAGAARLPRSTTGRPTAVSPTRTRTGGKWCSHPVPTVCPARIVMGARAWVM